MYQHLSQFSNYPKTAINEELYLGRRANTALIAQTAQNSIVAMVTNGTKYISQRKPPKLPSTQYHKNESTILPHKITWWIIVCKTTSNFNSGAEGFEFDKLAYELFHILDIISFPTGDMNSTK